MNIYMSVIRIVKTMSHFALIFFFHMLVGPSQIMLGHMSIRFYTNLWSSCSLIAAVIKAKWRDAKSAILFTEIDVLIILYVISIFIYLF